MNRDDIIEQAARVLAHLGPGESWYTNEALGGNHYTGTRDDEFRQEMIDQATDLWDAGLLARPLPTRYEISEVILAESLFGSRTPIAAANAVLALLKGQDQ